MADLVLTIDAGTSGCKAILFDLNGRTVAKDQRSYQLDITISGQAELNIEAFMPALRSAVKNAMMGYEPERVLGICVSAQLGIVFVDKAGRPLTNIISWMDKRAVDQAEQIRVLMGDTTVYRYAGRRIDPELPACKLLWLKQHKNEIFDRVHKLLSIKDYIVYWLTGEWTTDPIHASYSMMFDVARMRWHKPFFQTFDLPIEILPTVLDSSALAGRLRGDTASELNLKEGIDVYTGGPDGSLAALGAGLVEDGDVVHVVGTTDVILACSRKTIFDNRMRTLVNGYAIPGLWTIGGPMSTTGGCLQWFFKNFTRTSQGVEDAALESSFEALMHAAEEAGPGANDLFAIPSLVGERTPFWDPNVRGVIFGLTLNHSRAHIARAILEGSAYAAHHLMQLMENQGLAIEHIRMVGGGAQSRLWAAIRADVSGKPVVVPTVTEATCMGSALLVYVGAGVYSSYDKAAKRCIQQETTIKPDSIRSKEYQKRLPLYMKLHSDLTQSFRTLAQLRS